MKRTATLLIIALALAVSLAAQSVSRVWVADRGNGTYRNPVLNADYSDPDVIRTGDDYWMTSSSFNCIPALQILHSTDLVNWQIVSCVFDGIAPTAAQLAAFANSHGNGVWAPSIRYHNGWYYIFWGDPDRGIFHVKTQNPASRWGDPQLVYPGVGMIDPCPLWDDDGRVYLVHGWAGSRAGFKSVLSAVELDAELSRVISGEKIVFDGHDAHPTVEGPKFYKRNGFYYIFAPAGGVATGWQIVLRATSPYGPYECRTVMREGKSGINGPHQGAWIDDTEGQSWFLHFQDKGAYGRVVHLQPMKWHDDGWCTIGIDTDGDGVGEPVKSYRKPAAHQVAPIVTPVQSDNFESLSLGLQWQWHAVPQPWWAMTSTEGKLRLNCRTHDQGWRSLWDTPNLLLQKFPAEEFTTTVKIDFHPSYRGDCAGVVVMGLDYATIELYRTDAGVEVRNTVCHNADRGSEPETIASRQIDNIRFLRVRVDRGGVCSFFYSSDGKRFLPLGDKFVARKGKWIGAKVGLFATAEIKKNDGGRADIENFTVDK